MTQSKHACGSKKQKKQAKDKKENRRRCIKGALHVAFLVMSDITGEELARLLLLDLTCSRARAREYQSHRVVEVYCLFLEAFLRESFGIHQNLMRHTFITFHENRTDYLGSRIKLSGQISRRLVRVNDYADYLEEELSDKLDNMFNLEAQPYLDYLNPISSSASKIHIDLAEPFALARTIVSRRYSSEDVDGIEEKKKSGKNKSYLRTKYSSEPKQPPLESGKNSFISSKEGARR